MKCKPLPLQLLQLFGKRALNKIAAVLPVEMKRKCVCCVVLCFGFQNKMKDGKEEKKEGLDFKHSGNKCEGFENELN